MGQNALQTNVIKLREETMKHMFFKVPVYL